MKIGSKTKTSLLVKPKQSFTKNIEEIEDESEIKKINKDIIKASLYKQAYSAEVYSALAEDPTIFAYDLYKSKNSTKEAEEEEEVLQHQPKYHDQIKQIAEFKKKEREVIKERVEAQLREKEKEVFGETEAYYTQSYLQLLNQNKKFEEELEVRDKISQLHSIEYKNPEKFLNHIISDAPSEPCKKIKIETNEGEVKAEIVGLSEKRLGSEIDCARERYLARKNRK